MLISRPGFGPAAHRPRPTDLYQNLFTTSISARNPTLSMLDTQSHYISNALVFLLHQIARRSTDLPALGEVAELVMAPG